LPGRNGDLPKIEGEPVGRQRALHEIVLADRGAAVVTSISAPAAPSASARRLFGIVEGDAELQGNPAAGATSAPMPARSS